MILVDSSVWVDYFRGVDCPETKTLDVLLGTEEVATGDLILAEVLQGFVHDREFSLAKRLLLATHVLQLGGRDIAIKAAENYRALRKIGITVRKTVDTIIATHCIERGVWLLHSDRHFDPFATHLGLQVVGTEQ